MEFSKTIRGVDPGLKPLQLICTGCINNRIFVNHINSVLTKLIFLTNRIFNDYLTLCLWVVSVLGVG